MPAAASVVRTDCEAVPSPSRFAAMEEALARHAKLVEDLRRGRDPVHALADFDAAASSAKTRGRLHTRLVGKRKRSPSQSQLSDGSNQKRTRVISECVHSANDTDTEPYSARQSSFIDDESCDSQESDDVNQSNSATGKHESCRTANDPRESVSSAKLQPLIGGFQDHSSNTCDDSISRSPCSTVNNLEQTSKHVDLERADGSDVTSRTDDFTQSKRDHDKESHGKACNPVSLCEESADVFVQSTNFTLDRKGTDRHDLPADQNDGSTSSSGSANTVSASHVTAGVIEKDVCAIPSAASLVASHTSSSMEAVADGSTAVDNRSHAVKQHMFGAEALLASNGNMMAANAVAYASHGDRDCASLMQKSGAMSVGSAPVPVKSGKPAKKDRVALVAKCTEPRPGQTRYWTEAEHKRFLEAVARHGEKAYVAISNYVETRTPKQVRTHAQKFQMKMARLAKSGGVPPGGAPPTHARGSAKSGKSKAGATKAVSNPSTVASAAVSAAAAIIASAAQPANSCIVGVDGESVHSQTPHTPSDNSRQMHGAVQESCPTESGRDFAAERGSAIDLYDPAAVSKLGVCSDADTELGCVIEDENAVLSDDVNSTDALSDEYLNYIGGSGQDQSSDMSKEFIRDIEDLEDVELLAASPFSNPTEEWLLPDVTIA